MFQVSTLLFSPHGCFLNGPFKDQNLLKTSTISFWFKVIEETKVDEHWLETETRCGVTAKT